MCCCVDVVVAAVDVCVGAVLQGQGEGCGAIGHASSEVLCDLHLLLIFPHLRVCCEELCV